MYTTYEQKLEILQMLMNEADTARRALRKAERQYDSTGDLVERERAAVLMGLRRSQYRATQAAHENYYDTYIAKHA